MSDVCHVEFSTVSELEMYGIQCAPIHWCGRQKEHNDRWSRITKDHVCGSCDAVDDQRSISELMYETLGMFAMYGILVGTAMRVGYKLARTVVRTRKETKK